MRNIYFLGTRFDKLGISVDDFVSRWEWYESELRHESIGRSWVYLLIQSRPKVYENRSVGVTFLSENSLIMMIQLLIILRRDESQKVLLPSNNFWSLPVALILRKMVVGVKVQMAVHSDYDSVTGKRDFKNWIRNMLQNRWLKFTDSIRFVSDGQASIWIRKLDIRNPHVICPVPIEISHELLQIKPRTVAYVGRLHRERDPLSWCRIVDSLIHVNQEVRFSVVGSGHMERAMRYRLSKHADRINWQGKLNASQVSKMWSTIKILLITARSESYGLAAREALINGVFVVAPNNYANRELLQLSSEYVFLYDSDAGAIEAITKALDMMFEDQKVFYIRRR